MDERLRALLSSQHGVFLRRQALHAGVDLDQLRELIRSGELVRVRYGAYTTSTLWASFDDSGRHLLRCHAVLLSLDRPAVLSHSSAAVALGLPVWGIDLARVHVTRNDLHSSRLEAGVEHHAATLDNDDVMTVNGLAVTKAARTVVDVSRRYGFEPGVVVADAALHDGLVSREGLLEAQSMTDTWNGSRAAGRVIAFADGRSESVGESRARVCFAAVGLPEPELQYRISLDTGRDAVLDFYFPDQRTGGEFDGRLKYRVQPDSGPAAVEETLWRERQREQAIIRAGYELCRLVWVDLEHPERVRQRFLHAFEAARRRGLFGWSTA